MISSAAIGDLAPAELEFKTEAELTALQLGADTGDRARIDIFLALEALDRDPAEANEVLERAATALPESDDRYQAYFLAASCRVAFYAGRVTDARALCEQAVQLAEDVADPWVQARALWTGALVLHHSGDLVGAYERQTRAVAFAQQTGSAALVAVCLNRMGLIARARGDYRESLRHFTRAHDLINLDDYEELYRVLSFNLGLSYADLGEFAVAKTFYEGTLAWARAEGRSRKELTANIYIALADIGQDAPDAAITRLEIALGRQELRGDAGQVAFAQAVLADAYLAVDRLQEALETYKLGFANAARAPNKLEHRRLYIGYARAQFASGLVDDARSLLLSTISILRSEQSRELLLAGLTFLAELEQSAGNFEASLIATREANELQSELFNERLEREMAIARAHLDVDEANLRLAQARQERTLLVGVVLLAIASALIVYLIQGRKAQVKRAEQQEQQAQELEVVIAERTRELREQLRRLELAESAKVALERQLAEADKLRVLGQLTGGVAHDFNNLLTVVLGSAELLRNRVTDEKSLTGLVEHIIDAASSGADITRALMAYARKQPLQLERIELRSFLEERIPLIARTLGGMMEIRLDVDDVADVEVLLDGAQLTTALLNLALNAKDAQEARGDIVVRLATRDESWVLVSVIDTGCGMTGEQLARACEPFFTTKQDSQGSGLGLSMVYGFSKQLGGDLEIESTPGVGTVVSIVLPLGDARLTQPRGLAHDAA